MLRSALRSARKYLIRIVRDLLMLFVPECLQNRPKIRTGRRSRPYLRQLRDVTDLKGRQKRAQSAWRSTYLTADGNQNYFQ